MNIGITGAKGFLGQHILNALKRRSEVKSVSVFDLPESDILNKESVEKFVSGNDVIIHLAGLNRADDVDIMKINLLGALTLVKAIKDKNPNCRFIFASSFQVYSRSTSADVIGEDFPTVPLSIYGLSKLFGEQLAVSQLSNYAILRMSNIYGPGCRPFYNSVVATFVHLAKEGNEITINGSGAQARDFVFVDDVARAFELASFSGQSGIFNICSGEAVSLKSIAELLKKRFKDLKITYEPAEEDTLFTQGSCAKAKSLLKWSPNTTFEQGLVKCE